MTTSPDPRRRFTSDRLADVDEPVRRYFSHAISDGAALPSAVRMAMSGRIKVGLWLPFTAEQTVDGRSFTWRARVGRGPLTPLRVTDRYADAAGSTEGRLLGRVTLFHTEDVNTARSAATRAAIESVVFAPPSVLPGRGVAWRAETENVVVARFDLPPERPEVRVHIDEHGAIRTVSALRWGNVGEKTFQYIPRRRDPRRAPLRRPRSPQRPQRRLVVRDAALRAVLQGPHPRHQPVLNAGGSRSTTGRLPSRPAAACHAPEQPLARSSRTAPSRDIQQSSP